MKTARRSPEPASEDCAVMVAHHRPMMRAAAAASTTTTTTTTTTRRLRAVTFNIHSGINQEEDAYSLERIGRSAMGATAEPVHFLCIQEVERSAGAGQRSRKWSWQHSDDQVEKLAAVTGLEHTLWAPALHGIRYDPTVSTEEILHRDGEGDYGVAILSALPFEDTRLLAYTVPTPASSAELIYMDREQQPRGAAAALVRPEGAGSEGLLWVVTTHLSHLSGSEEQRGQARELMEWCDALRAERGGCPLLLCGDMNSAPGAPGRRGPGSWHVVTGHSAAAAAEPSNWVDCWEVVHGEGDAGGLTCPSHNPRARIDQFFLPRDALPAERASDSSSNANSSSADSSSGAGCVEAVDVKLIGAEDPHASDHLPVQLTIDFVGGGGTGRANL
jgi:endonuclease/exonuclease/phosphatase family metal-dependent hydrolase